MTKHLWLIVAFAATPTACTGSSTASTDTSASTSEVSSALSASTLDHATAVQCFADFKTCLQTNTDQASADACKATLETCLPSGTVLTTALSDLCTPPAPRPDSRGDLPSDGRNDRDHHPPASDGGMPDHDGMHPCGFGGPAGQACKDELKTCLADATSAPSVCADNAHTCLHETIAANFAAMCADQVAHCRLCSTTQTECDDLATKCAAGVPFPDPLDGGN